MEEKDNSSQMLMSPGDVCTLLDVKESTLRKYALLLTDAGYQFHVNEKGQRGYFNEDVIVLKKFLEIKDSRDMTLKQASKSVMSWVNQSNMSLSVIRKEDDDNRYDDDIKELKEMVNKQNELLQHLTEKLDGQQKYIDDRLSKRDETLMKVLNESLETKRMIAAADEEDKNKGFFARLFNK